MRLGLVSDIHGDVDALARVWSHLTALGVDQIVSVGDLVGYGPFPDRVVEFMKEHQIPAVRGNHDRWALSRGAGVADEFGGGAPREETIQYLAGLETELLVEAGTRIGVIVHGSPQSDMEFVNRQTHPPAVLRRYLRDLSCDLLVVGHTHQPMWYQSPAGRLVVNPGSVVSLPVIDSSRTFAVVDLSRLTVTFHNVEGGDPVSLDPWD
ncbi:MAG: metallophosphoesterase family protein [Isosphaeraceae bacterium]